MRTQTDLHIHAFGEAEVLMGEQPVQWRSESARSLFFYLLTCPEGCSREHILETLWDIPPNPNACNRFRVTVHRIRTALGWPGAVLEEHSRYRLAPEVLKASDVYAFYRALEQAHRAVKPEEKLKAYRQAISTYRGEYLPFEGGDWAGEVREQLRADYVRAELEVGHILCNQGNCAVSLEAQIRALQTDPYLGENHHQRLMGCLWHVQGKYSAIEHYRRYTRFLKEELHDTPMLETVELAEQIKQSDSNCLTCLGAWPVDGLTHECPFIHYFTQKSSPSMPQKSAVASNAQKSSPSLRSKAAMPQKSSPAMPQKSEVTSEAKPVLPARHAA